MDFVYDLMYPHSAKRNAWAEIIKIAYFSALLIFIAIIMMIMSRVCETKTTVTVYTVDESEVVFETNNGHLYAYELSPKSKWKFEIGEEWEVYFFDYETMSPYDDEITKIYGKVAESKEIK